MRERGMMKMKCVDERLKRKEREVVGIYGEREGGTDEKETKRREGRR